MTSRTFMQNYRQNYPLKLPHILQDLVSLDLEQDLNESGEEDRRIHEIFRNLTKQPVVRFKNAKNVVHKPLRVGVVLSGGPAPGGHNVIAGLFEALQKLHKQSKLFGFLNGPSGIIKNNFIELQSKQVEEFFNQGGFDLIGSGRTKIETSEQFQAAANTMKTLNLDGLVIVGGDDSNTNAALLADYFIAQNIETKVVGVPKTIDGDLKNRFIETSFGFDTATKVYSETIGNILRDCLSQKKYYFFVKLMGRSASHIALECALQTQPNMTLIGEEIAAHKLTLQGITEQITDLVCSRARHGKDYGVILVPEGIIEFIPEMNKLIKELNAFPPVQSNAMCDVSVPEVLSIDAKKCFKLIPKEIQVQMLLDRDPHGNVRVSQIETERLLISTVESELRKRADAGLYKGKFSPQPLFCGYEGRASFPTNFDCQYCYALGYVAALLIDRGCTGYMSCVNNLIQSVDNWRIAGVPLTSMIHIEERLGIKKPVIKKALVDLKGPTFSYFQNLRQSWVLEDDYRYPGPIQFFGPKDVTDIVTMTLYLESQSTPKGIQKSPQESLLS